MKDAAEQMEGSSPSILQTVTSMTRQNEYSLGI
jgi:hypothetical protein